MHDDFFELNPYVGIDFPKIFWEITPIAYFEFDLPLRTDLLKGGCQWRVGGKKTIEIVERPFDFKVELGGNDGIYDSTPMAVAFARGTVSTKVELLGLEVSPSITIQKGFGGIAETGLDLVAGFSISF